MILNFVGDVVINDALNIELSLNLKKLLKCGDYNVVNFEAPVKTENQKKVHKSGPSLSQDENAPHWLIKSGFNVISLANNHIFDYGDSGYLSTINSFKDNHFIGAGTWDEAYSPLIIEQDGLKVAVFSMGEQQFGFFFDKKAKGQKFGCAWINYNSVNDIITNTKKNVDYIIIIVHAGLECVDVPLPEWRARYRALIDLGCDVVIGGHTHTVQGFEIYKNKHIMYSLGNFCFTENLENNSKWNIGEFVKLNINKESIDVKTYGTEFLNNRIELLDDLRWNKLCLRLNNMLIEDYYDQYVREICLSHLNAYASLCSWGGYIHPSKINAKMLFKLFLSKITPYKIKFDDVHMLNNLQCETHRWCFERGLKIKNNLI